MAGNEPGASAQCKNTNFFCMWDENLDFALVRCMMVLVLVHAKIKLSPVLALIGQTLISFDNTLVT